MLFLFFFCRDCGRVEGGSLGGGGTFYFQQFVILMLKIDIMNFLNIVNFFLFD